ncbi:MAG: hypothetical protein JSS35_14245, partial [Proteobacteria bacterium]|nr:hypothetical protein [Pseudomonadota bacterium]
MSRMSQPRLVAACALSLLLAACGKGGAVKPAETKALKQGEGPHGAMTYGGKKIELNCPSHFDMPPPAQGEPVD